MNFKELYEKAEKNARKLERKVREADTELQKKQHKLLEQQAIERAREKLDLKRKLQQNPTQKKTTVNEQKRDQKFTIPKKNGEKVPSTSTAKRKDPKQPNPSDTKNKPPPPLPKSMKPANKPNPIDFKNLLKQAEKNDASAAELLFQQVETASSSKPSAPKRPRLEPDQELGVTAGLTLTYAAAAAKLKEKKMLAAKTEQNKAAEAQRFQRVQHTPKMQLQKTTFNSKPDLPPKQSQQLKNAQQQSMPQKQFSTHINAKPNQSNQTHQVQIQLQNHAVKKTEMRPRDTEKMEKSRNPLSLPTKAHTQKTAPASTTQPAPYKDEPKTTTFAQQSQKIYLPGDIRYTGPPPTVVAKKAQVPANGAALATRKPTTSASTAKLTQEMLQRIKERAKPATIVPLKKKPVMDFPQAQPNQQTNRKPNVEKTTLTGMKGIAQKREMPPPNWNHRRFVEEKNGKTVRAQESSNGNSGHSSKTPAMAGERQRFVAAASAGGGGVAQSLARIKKEAADKLQAYRQQSLKRIGHSSTPKSKPTSSNGGRRYANYSETDDDEEDDDEEGGGDEDLDSDLADFIDDSMVDDLQREDLEETLRILNPRYDKNKWLMRERMIDDRRMDARFNDVELEERRSAKLGLVEDLIEAKRGSKALS